MPRTVNSFIIKFYVDNMNLRDPFTFAALVVIAGLYNTVSASEVDRSDTNNGRDRLGMIHLRSKIIDTRNSLPRCVTSAPTTKVRENRTSCIIYAQQNFYSKNCNIDALNSYTKCMPSEKGHT